MENKNLKERIKRATIGEWINFVCCIVSVIMAIVGFIIPPTGQIDNSVLVCIGELGVFSTITKIPDFIRAMKNGAKSIGKGDTHIKIEGEEQ